MADLVTVGLIKDAASDEVVYRMAKAMYDKVEMMGQSFPPMRAFKPAEMRREAGVVAYHPGALRFFEEVGLQ